MSRYDGLIIPRSYNEYINKTDPVAMSQALQLNNVLAQEVAAGNNKAVTSNAVNGALENYDNKVEVNSKINDALENYDNKVEVNSKINDALADYNKSIGYDDTVATTKKELIKKKALIAIDKGLKNNCTCTLAGGWQGNQYGVSIITRLGTKYFVQFYGNIGWNIEGSYDTSNEEISCYTTSVTSSLTEFFSINSDLATLIDVRVYEILRIINFQRLVFTLKNNVTSGSSVHIGTIANERKPRQTMRVTMHDANTHISYECFIEQANGHIMLQANNNINANSTMVIDNFTYIY